MTVMMYDYGGPFEEYSRSNKLDSIALALDLSIYFCISCCSYPISMFSKLHPRITDSPRISPLLSCSRYQGGNGWKAINKAATQNHHEVYRQLRVSNLSIHLA